MNQQDEWLDADCAIVLANALLKEFPATGRPTTLASRHASLASAGLQHFTGQMMPVLPSVRRIRVDFEARVGIAQLIPFLHEITTPLFNVLSECLIGGARLVKISGVLPREQPPGISRQPALIKL